MRRLLKDIGCIEATISIASIIIAIIFLISPSSGDFTKWLGPFWLRIIGITILNLLLLVLVLRNTYKAWANADTEREKLQNNIDSKAPNVELIRFDHELQYEVNRNNNGLIEIHVCGELINNSMENTGNLREFWIDILTNMGTPYRANTEHPERNYLFTPHSTYHMKHFVFTGNVVDELAKEVYHIESWEPYIRGSKGWIYLDVLGQELKTYEIKMEDEGRIWKGEIF